MKRQLPDWPQVEPRRPRARIRLAPEDFRVDEELGFEPVPGGEHVWLQIEKTGLNTEQLAARIARHAGVRRRQVSYAGLKDRHAVTSQWFSVQLPGKGLDMPDDWQLDDGAAAIRVLHVGRYARKLRRGAHRGNRFRIVLDVDAQPSEVERLLARVRECGAPNYFGAQRFGIDGGNLADPQPGQREDRFLRGLRLSAWRSWIFNSVLARRVADGSWDQALVGDAIQFDGSGSWYRYADADAETPRRIAVQDAHPTGPLWGSGEPPVSGAVLALEQAAAAAEPGWCEVLAGAGMKQERRALRLRPQALCWHWDASRLVTEFSLPRGAYATSLLAAAFVLQMAEREPQARAGQRLGTDSGVA